MVEKEEQKGKYQYDEKDKIGEGTFGIVYKGKFIDEKGKTKVVALKEIPEEVFKTRSEMESFYNEISILSKLKEENKEDPLLSNENIVNFLGITNLNNKTFLVYEFCNGGDLKRYLKFFKGFDEKMVQYIISQVLKGLQFIHNKNIIHHDIKPNNILVDLCVEEKTQKEKESKINMIMEGTNENNRDNATDDLKTMF